MISVIIPTFNRAKTISDSVNSVLRQTYTDIEVIVVDDGSTDNTQTLIESIKDNRLRYVHLEHAGACAARNYGISISRGEYIAFHDSDDICRNDKLEKQFKTLTESGCDLVFCAVNRHKNQSNKEKRFPDMPSGIKSFEEILMGFYVSTQTILAKSDVFRKTVFDENLRRLQDYDLVIRIAKNHKIYYLNECLVDVFRQEDSITELEKSYSKQLEVFSYLLNKYPDISASYPKWKNAILARIAFYKTMLGRDAFEYEEIVRYEKTVKNRLKLFLSRTKLLRLYYSMQIYKKTVLKGR